MLTIWVWVERPSSIASSGKPWGWVPVRMVYGTTAGG
jgi:hypothetical protein